MKHFHKPLLLILLVIGSIHSGCQAQEFEKVSDSEINNQRLDFITELSDKMLSTQKQGGFYALNESEASGRMIQGMSESIQKQSYTQIQSLFGDYQSLEFNQLMKSKDGKFEVYRFKGTFDSTSEVEIRAILNEEGKMAGFFIKPWNDDLQ